MEFQNKVALVTGAESGIGQAIALRLARAGARIIVNDLDALSAEKTVEKLNDLGAQGVPIQADIANPDDVGSMVAQGVKMFGSIDILVNNAGIGGASMLVKDLPPEAWERALAVNLKGAFNCCQAVIPIMTPKGWGKIVNIASLAASRMSKLGGADYTEAVAEALRQEMLCDENVVVMGLDVKPSIWGTTRGLYEDFGPERIISTPVCEGSFAMAGVGAAMTGLKPVVEFLFSEYTYLAMDAIANTAGVWGYVSNNGYSVPIVFQTFAGARGHGAYSHSQSTHASFLNAAGIKIVFPSTPADAKGLLTSAIRDAGPVLVYHHRQLLAVAGEVPAGEYLVPIGKGAIRRSGSDVTVVSFGGMLVRCMEAADELEKNGRNNCDAKAGKGHETWENSGVESRRG